jgi:hypothetical protein
MNQPAYVISFSGDVPLADRNVYAGELQDFLLDSAPDVQVSRRKDDPGTQDFGATLLLILGTQAALSVAKSLGDWLELHRRVRLEITTPSGKVIGTNLTSKDMRYLADKFAEAK